MIDQSCLYEPWYIDNKSISSILVKTFLSGLKFKYYKVLLLKPTDVLIKNGTIYKHYNRYILYRKFALNRFT